MFEQNTTKTIFAAVALGGVFYLAGQYIASQPQRIQEETEAKREISVQGKGEVEAKPDIAKITLGVTTGAQSSAKIATDMLAQKFDAVVKAVKAKNVDEEDIKTTNLSVNPVYDYSNGQQTIRGYEASESIEVKIRDLDKVGEIVTTATQQGVNQVGGISFEIDSPENLQEQAQTKAIDDARERAERLAKALGANLGRVKTFVTDNGDRGVPVPMYAELKAAGQGGDNAVPPVQAGINTVTATVTVTFELR